MEIIAVIFLLGVILFGAPAINPKNELTAMERLHYGAIALTSTIGFAMILYVYC